MKEMELKVTRRYKNMNQFEVEELITEVFGSKDEAHQMALEKLIDSTEGYSDSELLNGRTFSGEAFFLHSDEEVGFVELAVVTDQLFESEEDVAQNLVEKLTRAANNAQEVLTLSISDVQRV
jgi:hypothetical protein